MLCGLLAMAYLGLFSLDQDSLDAGPLSNSPFLNRSSQIGQEVHLLQMSPSEALLSMTDTAEEPKQRYSPLALLVPVSAPKLIRWSDSVSMELGGRDPASSGPQVSWPLLC